MTTYSEAELEALMSDLESDLVERKESAADGKKIRRNVCAFANDLPGNGRPGVVLVGVRDDGSCASLPIDDALLTKLANIRGDGDVLPLPSMTVQRRVLRGCEVAVVSVEPSVDTPVRYQGRVWVRVGPSVHKGSVEDERLLTERRRSADLPFDSRPAGGAGLDDLDRGFLRSHYLPGAIWFSDRVEIANPGGLYGRITRDNFGAGDTDYRNPLLAEIMANLGFAQRFGLGVPLARKALEANGNPAPEFEFQQTLVVATVRIAP